MSIVTIRITESGGSPSAKTSTILTSLNWAIMVPIMEWDNSPPSIGSYGKGIWVPDPFHRHILFTEIDSFYPYTSRPVMTFYNVSMTWNTIHFPFTSGIKGYGMYHLYTLAPGKFFRGGIWWEVL